MKQIIVEAGRGDTKETMITGEGRQDGHKRTGDI